MSLMYVESGQGHDAGVPYAGIYRLSAELLDRKSPKRHAIGNSVVESTAFPFFVAGNNPPAIKASRQELSSVANPVECVRPSV
jgi:hypothetical protein